MINTDNLVIRAVERDDLETYRYHHKKWRDFVMYSILREDTEK